MKHMIPRWIGAVALTAATIYGGVYMDDLGEFHKDHQFVVQFQRGALPDPSYTETIADAAALMDGNPNYEMIIIGHTGTRGPDDSNLALSNTRAERVRDDLIKGNRERPSVAASRIQLLAAGETEPLPRGEHETAALWEKRLARVDIIIEVK